ncbi:MAG TPA: WG repeat-containing protein [Candidatus Solibacter sp.]|nr:WG repeat-containing protein [Candidatus Solibacter sp.]
MKIAAILTLFTSSLAWAQTGNDWLFAIRDGRKIGFINRAGAIVVPPRFEAAGEPHEGRISIYENGHAGYIDFAGKIVVEPKYDSAGDFRDSRAIVRVGTKASLIDPSGAVVGEIPYRPLGDFHQGLLRVQASGLVDSSGKKLPTVYGFVDRQAKMVIPPQFLPAGEFYDDPANLPLGGLGPDWVYFDRTGKVIIRISKGPHLENPDLFSNGRLRVKDGFTWGYKDASGAWAIPAKYNDAENFKDGLARVQEGDKWIVIDVRGKTVPPDKKRIHVIGPYSEGLALAIDNGLTGWVDAEEHLAFPLRKYQKAFRFSSGLARFQMDDLYGYLDKSGKIAIPNKFEDAGDFDHGLARILTRDGFAYIDTAGKVVWQSAKRQ